MGAEPGMRFIKQPAAKLEPVFVGGKEVLKPTPQLMMLHISTICLFYAKVKIKQIIHNNMKK